jgi:hypothetical protein
MARSTPAAGEAGLANAACAERCCSQGTRRSSPKAAGRSKGNRRRVSSSLRRSESPLGTRITTMASDGACSERDVG